MSQSVVRQPAILMPVAPALRASAERIAASLGESAGACACCLLLSGVTGRRPRLLVRGGDSQSIVWNVTEIMPILRRAREAEAPAQLCVGGRPGLALALRHEGQAIGAALLIYADERAIDVGHAAAAASLAAVALDSQRQLAALGAPVEDVEDHVRLREIQVSRNLIRGVIDSIPMGLALLDSEGLILAANRALSNRFDLDPATLVGMTYGEAIGSWDESPAAQTFASGAISQTRRMMIGPNGGQTLLEIVSIPLLDTDGQPCQVVEVWEDITERVALQTQLVRAEKLAAIGQLAASIAHEVGNPLQAIQGFLSLFLEQCAPETPNRRFLELAEEEIERIVHVVARLRDLYRPRTEAITPINVNELIDGVLLLTGKQLERSRVRVVRELDPVLPRIQAVADQIKQVLLNLVLNAVQAMPRGGVLHIQTAARGCLGSRDTISISVTDTGVGIPPDQLPHIFDGLHTTKERGMGLGLYTSRAIIERHMGRISVQSVVGESTTFTITLPIRSKESPDEPVSADTGG